MKLYFARKQTGADGGESIVVVCKEANFDGETFSVIEDNGRVFRIKRERVGERNEVCGIGADNNGALNALFGGLIGLAEEYERKAAELRKALDLPIVTAETDKKK